MERLSMQRQLPSLSDVFDARSLPGTIRPETNGFRFPGPGHHPPAHPGGDAHPVQIKSEQQPFTGSLPPNQAFSHQPRTPVDGPLPIHALLASKPEPAFEARPPLPHPYHGTSHHVDQKPRIVHQTPNGVAGLPVINGAPSNRPNPGMLLTWMPKVIAPGPRSHNTR